MLLNQGPMSDAPRILVVVDANFDVANALADAAAEHGWEPFLAGGAEAALGILPKLEGEVLLLVDLASPVSGGLALLLALRRTPQPPGLRVLVMSSGQPVPAVARSSPFVLGVVKKPRHAADAAGLIRALVDDAERSATVS
jgi:DNA-binding NtrC family response regulator